MDGNRFDTWTRTRATAANRRSLLGWSLTGGLAAVFSRLEPASAQFGGNGSCTYSVTLTSSLAGGGTVSGTLVVDIGNGGAIDTGSLTLAGQTPASVVGQATGPAIAILASLTDGTVVSLTGVANAPVGGCSSAILGVLANTDGAQIGTWQAQPGSSGQSSAPPPNTGSSQSTTSNPAPATGSGQSTTSDTGNTNQPAASCDPPKMLCGPTCCPAGSDCYDSASGGCACPDGTEECGIACIPSCTDGVTPLDPVTCLCPTG